MFHSESRGADESEDVEDVSLRLLRAMVEQRRKGLSEGDAAAAEAAKEAGIEPHSSEYHAALEYLLTSGDVEPHPNETLAAQGIYRSGGLDHALRPPAALLLEGSRTASQ
jgi:hypothetical protein